MTAITLPKSVNTLGEGVLFGCVVLQTCEMPVSIGSMGEGMFQRCDKLQQVIWSPSQTVVPKRMFFQCYELEWITLPDNVTAIEEEAFGECYLLRQFHFPTQLKTIGEAAFDGADLENLVLPQGVTVIGANAFNYNYNVEEVYIPSSVSVIGSGAFNNMPHIKKVTVDRVSPPSLGVDGFHFLTYASANLNVPLESTRTYKTAAEWSNFQYINDPTTGIESLEMSADGKNIPLYDLEGRRAAAGTRGPVVDPCSRTLRIVR